MSKTESEQVERALSGLYSVIRGLLATGTLEDAMTRHRAGDALLTAKRSPNTYGKRYVERVADELGLSARALYQYIAVAETWTAVEVRAVLERTNRFGMPVSWSHFVSLTRVRDDTLREAVLDECIRDGWSVRELERRIDEQDSLSAFGSGALQPGEAVRAALKESIQTGSRAIADLRLMRDALGERLRELDERRDDELLSEALQIYEELQLRAETMLDQLRMAKHKTGRVKSPAAARDSVEEALEEEPDTEGTQPAERMRRAPPKG